MLLVSGVYLKKQFASGSDTVKGLDPEVGSQIGNIQGLDYSETPNTLMVAISSHCRFCLESMPFYKEMNQKRSRGGKVRLVFVHPVPDVELKGILQHNGISDPVLFPADLQSLKIQRTPAIILVDAVGGIQRTWIGKLSSSGEGEIHKVLN